MAQGHRYVALLRGIAPSGKNMSNAHLRGAVEGLGYTDVASVQASGNILFTTDETDVAAPQLHLTDVVGFDRAHGVLLTVTDNSEPGRTGGFMAWLERAYGKATTTRSWPTVQRLAARLSD